MLIACFAAPQIGIACERSRVPLLWGKPVALASDQNIITVASNESIPFGVRVGQSVTAARSFCKDLAVLPYDAASYQQAARDLWDAYAVESSFVEPVSPELCYVATDERGSLARIQRLQALLVPRLRVPVRAGVGSSKIVAYFAAQRDEECRTVAVPAGSEVAFLSTTSLDAIPQLDAKLCTTLQRLGIRKFRDLLCIPENELRTHFRDRSLWLKRLARGQDDNPVKALWPPRRLQHTIDLEYGVTDERAIHQALSACVQQIVSVLSRNREYCRELLLDVTLADSGYLHKAERLATPTADPRVLERVGLRLFQRMTVDQPILACSVVASDLGSASARQLVLIDDNQWLQGLPHEREERIGNTLSFLRERFGIGSVVPLRLLQQARRIALWTYTFARRLDEPVEVVTDAAGAPLRVLRSRRGGSVCGVRVKQVVSRWRETEWFWGASVSRTVWRVETEEAGGFFELAQKGDRWHVVGVAD